MQLPLLKPASASQPLDLDAVTAASPVHSAGGVSAEQRLIGGLNVYQELSDLELPYSLRGTLSACFYLARYSMVHRRTATIRSAFPITDVYASEQRSSSDATRQAASADHTSMSGPLRAANRLIKHHWKLKELGKAALFSMATYSNAIIQAKVSFTKTMTCRSCKKQVAGDFADWTFARGTFVLTCECGHTGAADVTDIYATSAKSVRFQNLDIRRVYCLPNEWSGEHEYYYLIPHTTQLRMEQAFQTDRRFLLSLPQEYFQAVFHPPLSMPNVELLPGVPGRHLIRLRNETLFHMYDTELPSEDGLAWPAWTVTLPDYWQYRLLVQSQQAVCKEFILPHRAVYPEDRGGGGTASLATMVNLSSIVSVLRRETERHKVDRAYTSVFPFPIGSQVIGGEAKALMMSQEIRVALETQCVGAGAPLEFIFGGMSYSGSSVSVKQQEVVFNADREKVLDLYNWCYTYAQTTFEDVPDDIAVAHKDFRMGEDLAHVQTLSGLQSQGILSLQAVLDALGVDAESEKIRLEKDAQWFGRINMLRMRPEAQANTDSLAEQAEAQARGAVTAAEATLDAVADAQARLERGDQRRLLIAQTNPAVASILYPAGPSNTMPMGPPVGTDPTLGMGPAMGDLAEEPLEKSASPDVPTADELAQSIANNVPAEQWAATVENVRSMYGDGLAQEVSGILQTAGGLAKIEPDQRPATARSAERGGAG